MWAWALFEKRIPKWSDDNLINGGRYICLVGGCLKPTPPHPRHLVLFGARSIKMPWDVKKWPTICKADISRSK